MMWYHMPNSSSSNPSYRYMQCLQFGEKCHIVEEKFLNMHIDRRN